MMQLRLPALLCVAALALTSVTARAAEQPWVGRSNDNAKLLLDIMAKYEPEDASQLGVDGYDEAITDLRHDDYEPHQADLRAAVAEYERRAEHEADRKVRQDLQILITAAQNDLATNALDRKYFFPYRDLTRNIYEVVQNTIDPRVPLARKQAIVRRLEKDAGMARDYAPSTVLAEQRTLERIHADPALLGPYRGQVEQGLEEFPTLLAGIRSVLEKSKVKGWQASCRVLEGQLTQYNDWVRSEILPRARADHRLPRDVYANQLHQYGIDITPEDLVSRALTSFAEIRNQMTITAGLVAKQRGFTDPDYRAVIRRLKQEQIPADQVMPLYRARLAEIEAAIRDHHIVTLPERNAVIRLATPAENAVVPAPHMNPPRMIGNTGEYGEFVLATGMPPDASGKSLTFDDFSNPAVTWTLTAHEARPGHELQFAKMIEAGVSTARAVFAMNSVNVEGWGLYSEAEMQPYEPLDGQLFALQARALRAARAFLDPMVNLGQVTPEQVQSFLAQEVCQSEGMAKQEMQRYVFRSPGQATSYFYGYQRMMETRAAAEVALRDRFDRQAFNDFVLAQGVLPPRLLREAVDRDFIGAQLRP